MRRSNSSSVCVCDAGSLLLGGGQMLEQQEGWPVACYAGLVCHLLFD